MNIKYPNIKHPIFFTLIFILVMGIGLIGGGWYQNNRQKQTLNKIKIENFTLKVLPEDQRPYYTDEPPIDLNREDLKNDFLQKRGFDYIYKDGSKYNPVTVTHVIMALIDGFRQNHDQAYLEKAETYTQGLLRSAVHSRGALFFPYTFNFKIGGGGGDKMTAPWYSGMAQGQILSILVRLYEITGKEQYHLAAQQTFKSLELFKQDSGKMWVTMIDNDGYFWIEEYPMEETDHTLNGFLYATFGLYDYYLLEKSPQSGQLLKAAWTTAKQYIPQYRNPNGISFYSLKYKQKNIRYHRTHIKQMEDIYAITGDEFFKNMAETFLGDRK